MFSPAPRRASAVNEDIGMEGGTFMTEPKGLVRKSSSRMNLNQASPDRASAKMRANNRSSDMDLLKSSPVSFMNNQGSPNASTGQLVSFNFLTQVPIEEFVIQEQSKASKMSARMKSNHSMKIERELERKIKEK